MKIISGFKKQKGFYKRWLCISFICFLLALILLNMEIIRPIDDYLFAIYNQRSVRKNIKAQNISSKEIEKQERIYDKDNLGNESADEKRNNLTQVVIVKRDTKSSALLSKIHKFSGDRGMYANLINFLGNKKIIKLAKNKNVRNIKFLTMDIGLFKNVKDLPISTSFDNWNGVEINEGFDFDLQKDYNSQAALKSGSQKLRDWYKNTGNPGISSFIKVKEDLWPPRGRNVFKVFSAGSYLEINPLLYQGEPYKSYELSFLVLPSMSVNWLDKGLIKAVNDFALAVKSGKKYSVPKEYKDIFKLLWQWTNFFINAAFLDIKPTFEFPSYDGKFDEKGHEKDVTLCRFSLSFTTEINKDYIIPAASVIGIDFVLDEDKGSYENQISSKDIELVNALKNCDSKIVLASYQRLSSVVNENDITSSKVGEKAVKIDESGEIKNYLSLLRSDYSRKVDLIKPAEKFLRDINSNKKYDNVSSALINILTGNKGYVTSVPLYETYGGASDTEKIIPAFSLKIAMEALDARARLEDSKDKDIGYVQSMYDELERIRKLKEQNIIVDCVKIKDIEIPVDSRGNMHIDYVSLTSDDELINSKSSYEKEIKKSSKMFFPSYSMYECIGSEALTIPDTLSESDKKELKLLDYKIISNRVLGRDSWLYDEKGGNKTGLGSIVLFGPFEIADMDNYPTPLTLKTGFRFVNQDNMMGIEIHANAIINIMDKLYLKPPKFDLVSVFILLISSLIFGFLLEILSPLLSFIITILSFVFVLYGGYYSYIEWRKIVFVSPYLFVFTLSWILFTLMHYIQQRTQTKTTKEMFSRFVSADVVKYILDNPESVKPGGEKVELTVLFTDVAGFTSISEKLTPEELVILLNEYLGAMTDIIFKYGGTLDKFVGDAVMAFWNYPKKHEDHCLRACLCAIEMQNKINELQIGWAKRGLPKVSSRCGINSAEVVVGYMGSIKAQMNFTCIGDGVNLASRLEGANKEYGTKMMISETVYKHVKDRIVCRFLDYISVKGKNEPVKVYEIISEIGKEPDFWKDLSEKYDKAVKLYLDRKWDDCIALLDNILKDFPNDGPSSTYKARCIEYKNHPPPENWDGRYIFTHK